MLQCDGASTLNDIAKEANRRGGCHSHARSKLVEALNSGESRAIPALLLYARLFAIEAESKASREDFDARLARRIVRSRPLIQELSTWVDEMRPQIEPRTPPGKALTYLTRQRARLELFLSDGRVAMTNNAVERELRTHVLNRKTWLFCGSEQSAKRMAAALTIVRTCNLNGIDVRAYLRFVVRRILAGERDASSLWPENGLFVVGAASEAESCVKVAANACVALQCAHGTQGRTDRGLCDPRAPRRLRGLRSGRTLRADIRAAELVDSRVVVARREGERRQDV